jgi:hypothetical protein
MHADRVNRAVLFVLGCLLVAAGVVGALAGFGAFGHRVKNESLVDNPVARYDGTNGKWLWPVIAVIAALAAVLALRWLWLLLFSTDRAGDLRIESRQCGRTTMAPGALADAVADEVSGYRGVEKATARLIGDSAAPTLVIEARLDYSADPSGVRRRIEAEAVDHARSALADSQLPVRLDLTMTDGTTRRVT